MQTKPNGKLGVDLGGVICTTEEHMPVEQRLTYPDRTTNGYLKAPTLDGALETLKRLMENGFETVVLISKIELDNQVLARAHDYLNHHGFGEVIRPENRHFCDDRSKKVTICREEGVSVFVDDRLDVLRHMVEVVPNLFLFRPWDEEDKRYWYLVEEGRVQVVHSWKELAERLLGSS